LGASQIEKSTLDAKKFGYTQKREYGTIDSNPSELAQEMNVAADMANEIEMMPAAACSISSDPDCEVCQ
jgi:hypothetical protein